MKFALIILSFMISSSDILPRKFIYYSRKVFTYNVEIRKKQTADLRTKIFLTTFDEVWFYDNEQKWISWVDQIQNISKKHTGVEETHSRIFLHPPRHNQYAILEFSPFPIVQFPLSVGKEWSWTNTIGYGWAKAAGIQNFKDVSDFIFYYKVTGNTTLKYDGETIRCFIIEASCKSQYGNSKLISFFNDKYGFVKMEYLNMDDSIFIFSLFEIKDLSTVENSLMFLNYDFIKKFNQ